MGLPVKYGRVHMNEGLRPDYITIAKEAVRIEESERIDKLRELGDCLHARRVELGLSARKAARLAGISAPYLLALETGENPKTHRPSRPNFEILSRIDEILGLNGETFELAGYPPMSLPRGQESFVKARRSERVLESHFTELKTALRNLDEAERVEMLGVLSGLVDRYKAQ